MNTFKLMLLAAVAAAAMQACSPAEGNFAGSEYMPDMGHSVAIEANVYGAYKYNTWDKESTAPKADFVRNITQPVLGTVPRGYAGVALGGAADVAASQINGMVVPVNGQVPYYYADTEEERLRATAEILANPFPITAAGLGKGKELYNIFCGVCHGEKGNGLGYLYAEENPNAKYPAAPANFLNEEFSAASNGRYYHAIMYGKNVMGGYADKLSYEERWQVIHWIRALQAQDKKLTYTDSENTLNPSFGTPSAAVKAAGATSTEQTAAPAATGSSQQMSENTPAATGKKGGR